MKQRYRNFDVSKSRPLDFNNSVNSVHLLAGVPSFYCHCCRCCTYYTAVMPPLPPLTTTNITTTTFCLTDQFFHSDSGCKLDHPNVNFGELLEQDFEGWTAFLSPIQQRPKT